MNISAYSIRRPLPAIVFSIVTLLLGWISFNKLPITRYPNVDVPVVSVTVTQFGAAPAELEVAGHQDRRGRAFPASRASSTSTPSITDGMSITTITVPAGDQHRPRAQRRQGRGHPRARQPAARHRRAAGPAVDIAGLPILTYAAIAPGKTPEQLSWFVDDVVIRALQGVRGVAQVERIGGVEREILVVARSRPAAGGRPDRRSMSADSCAAATSTSPAGAPKSAGATRRSARSPAPRRSTISPARGSPCRRRRGAARRSRHSSPTPSPSRAPLPGFDGDPVVGFSI